MKRLLLLGLGLVSLPVFAHFELSARAGAFHLNLSLSRLGEGEAAADETLTPGTYIFQLYVRDEAFQTVDEAQATLTLSLDDRREAYLTLEPQGQGAYRGQARLDAPGSWQVRVQLVRGETTAEAVLPLEVAAGRPVLPWVSVVAGLGLATLAVYGLRRLRARTGRS